MDASPVDRFRRKTGLAVPLDCCSEPATIGDAADGTDGTLERCAHPNDSASGSTFTTEGNVDTKRPKKCLRATQAASEGAWIFRPADAGHWDLASIFKAAPQKVGGTAGPRAAFAHEQPHARGDWVCVDDAFDRGFPVLCVSATESVGGPEAPFASRRPEDEIGHPRQPVEVNATQRLRPWAAASSRAPRIHGRARSNSRQSSVSNAAAPLQSAPRSEKSPGRPNPAG